MMYERKIKVVVAGNSSVGKTCIIKRLESGEFEDDTASSIGVAVSTINTEYNKKPVEFAIWDTAGQEKFKSLSPVYFRDAAIGIFVFDITDDFSFESITNWYRFATESNITEEFRAIIVGNKIDLEDKRVIESDKIYQIASTIKNSTCVEVSAKTGENIGFLLEIILKNVDEYMGWLAKVSHNSKSEATGFDRSDENTKCC